MSRDKLGSKQTSVKHKCLDKNERHYLVFTPHRQIIGYDRSKRQTRKKTFITKHQQIIKRITSKRKNAVSESGTNTIEELQDLKKFDK